MIDLYVVLHWVNYMQASKASILVDASKHIQELKEKVARLNEDISTSCSYQIDPSISSNVEDHQRSFPKVRLIMIYAYLHTSSVLKVQMKPFFVLCERLLSVVFYLFLNRSRRY